MIIFEKYRVMAHLHLGTEFDCLSGETSNTAIGFAIGERAGRKRWEEIRLWEPSGTVGMFCVPKRPPDAASSSKLVKCGNCKRTHKISTSHPRALFKIWSTKRATELFPGSGLPWLNHPRLFALNASEISELRKNIDNANAVVELPFCRSCSCSANRVMRHIKRIDFDIAALKSERAALVESMKSSPMRVIPPSAIKFFQMTAAATAIKQHYENTNSK